MPTQEIPNYEWASFFDEFSRRHERWLVNVEMLSPVTGDQVLLRDLPLEGITADPNEMGEDQITIIAGTRPDARISHTIEGPNRVWLKQTDEGADDALEIESVDGAVLVSFRSTALPEMVDGLLAKGAEAGKRSQD
jgi:hypothetical protein